jgi:hypothetical protein
LAFRISFDKRRSYAGPGDTISYCLFERSYAEALGIDVERGVPLNFATAKAASRLSVTRSQSARWISKFTHWCFSAPTPTS